MIVINMQLKSAISESRNAVLGTLIIVNDGSSTNPNRGNYHVQMRGKTGRVIRSGEVKDHSRKSLPVGTLVRKALEAMKY
jgi:hypothetical protein